MNYKKKLFFVALSTLLLSLLLGICGTCYADSTRTWTKADIKNVIYNNYIKVYANQTNNEQLIESFITNTVEQYLDTFLSYINNADYVCIISNNAHNLQFITNVGYSGFHPYIYSGSVYNFGKSGNLSNTLSMAYYGNSSDACTINNSSGGSFTDNNSCVFYTTTNLYNSSNGNTVVKSAGYYRPSTMFDEHYSNTIWQFDSNGSNVTINGANAWTYKLIDGGYGVELGQLIDSAWCGKVSYRIAYWNNLTKSFGSYGNFTILYDKESSNLPMYNVYANVTTQNGNNYTTKILFDTYNYKNCLLQIMIEPWATGSIFTNLYQDYYIQGETTIVSSGVVYPVQTFSGDYVGEYQEQENSNNNQNDIADIKDTLTDDSEANNLLNEFTSGDLATNLGFNPLSNPYYDFLYGFLDGIVSTLLDDNNVTLEISYFGKTIILHSEDFITPTNTLTNFIKYILIFFYIFACFKFFYSIYITFETADVEKLKKNLGHDQYYYNDGKYM